MNQLNPSITRSQESVLATNKVLKNTYMLLSMTLMFSALTAFVGVQISLSPIGGLLSTLAGIGLLWFALPKTAHTSAGLGVTFAFTGLLGLGLAPTLQYYLKIPNGADIVMSAFGGTGAIFLGLSGYALTSRKNFSFMGGMLMSGMFVVMLAAFAGIFLQMPGLQVAISAMVVLLMSGMILYETSQIIHNGETNYIYATANLYMSILNLFTSLLQLLGIFSSDD